MEEDIFFRTAAELLKLNSEKKAALKRLGIENIRDLLFYAPLSYRKKKIDPDLSDLVEGDLISAKVKIDSLDFPKRRGSPVKVAVSNSTGSILLIFFNRIPKFILPRLKIGNIVRVAGKVRREGYYFQIAHPEFLFGSDEADSETEPLYGLTYGLLNKSLRSYIWKAFEKIENSGSRSFVVPIIENLKGLHLIGAAGEDPTRIMEEARKNLAAEELKAYRLSLDLVRKGRGLKKGIVFKKNEKLQNKILENLGFEPTDCQKRALAEIEGDQFSEGRAHRMLQGDVGSGKTLVALLSAVNPVVSGFCSALAVPTDLLARQHYEFFARGLDGTEVRLELLTGKTGVKEKKRIYSGVENGVVDIIIGTHALFQEKLNFKNLGYVIIDEQHRFGVEQRLALAGKASSPDVLFMSATPIPRSLSMTMFGDMDISKLREKPAGRPDIETFVVNSSKLSELKESLAKKIAEGEKIYWICPLIEQNPESPSQYTDVYSRFESLSALYPGITGILHGKTPKGEKDSVMEKFKSGGFKILVATTVIEVGIDVKDATLIIIENAEKFGLAQLHQLRGRVGRGNSPSSCVGLYNPKYTSALGRKRLETFKNSRDGFYIAEQDLILRGSGEILGTRQSGEPNFFFADMAKDSDLFLMEAKLSEGLGENLNFLAKLFARKEEFEV